MAKTTTSSEAEQAAPRTAVKPVPPLPIERLDRSRAFGYVQGETAHAIAFEQKGWPYDAQGELIEDALNAAQQKTLDERRARLRAKIDAGEAEEAPEEEEVPEDEPPAEDPDNEDVNLDAWLRGEAKYRPVDLQKAGKKRYGVNKAKPGELARYLVEEQRLMPWGEVTPALRPRGQ